MHTVRSSPETRSAPAVERELVGAYAVTTVTSATHRRISVVFLDDPRLHATETVRINAMSGDTTRLVAQLISSLDLRAREDRHSRELSAPESAQRHVLHALRYSPLLSETDRARLLADAGAQRAMAERVAAAEAGGVAYKHGPASLELLALRQAGAAPERVVDVQEPRIDSRVGRHSEASIRVRVLGKEDVRHVVAESGNGTVEALWLALQKAFNGERALLGDLKLLDYNVFKSPASDEGAGSFVQVTMDFERDGRRFCTTAGSTDIHAANWQALRDGVEYALHLATQAPSALDAPPDAA
jgi:hypothetical protein